MNNYPVVFVVFTIRRLLGSCVYINLSRVMYIYLLIVCPHFTHCAFILLTFLRNAFLFPPHSTNKSGESVAASAASKPRRTTLGQTAELSGLPRSVAALPNSAACRRAQNKTNLGCSPTLDNAQEKQDVCLFPWGHSKGGSGEKRIPGRDQNLEPKWHRGTCTPMQHEPKQSDDKIPPPNQCLLLTGCVITCGDIHTNSALQHTYPPTLLWHRHGRCMKRSLNRLLTQNKRNNATSFVDSCPNEQFFTCVRRCLLYG